MRLLKWLKSLLGGKVGVEKVFDSVSKGIDNLGFSQQEKAEGVKDFVKETLSENSQRSKARRQISKVFLYYYLLLASASIAAVIIDVDIAKSIIEIVRAYNLGWAFLAIIGFYFGGYYLPKVGRQKKEKKTE